MARSDRKSAQYNEENLRRAREAGTRPGRINVGPTERVASAVAGLLVLGYALRTRRLPAVLLPMGAGLLARAVTGHSLVNQLLGRNAHAGEHTAALGSVHSGKGLRVDRTVRIDRPVAEIYGFLRDFENLPRFLEHVESVINLDDHRSHWIARGPAGLTLEWDVELLNEEPEARLAWRSLPGSDLNHAGSVHFRPAATGRSTEVRVIMSYEPVGGKLGTALARLLGRNPGQQIQKDLEHLKQLVESGVAGRPRGTERAS